MAPPPPPPPSLMEELVEEILLRLPPEEPASLVRAALVCKLWRRLVSSPRFGRRFLELHRTPPMLGFICNSKFSRSSFVRPAASPLHGNTTRWWNWCVLDQCQFSASSPAWSKPVSVQRIQPRFSTYGRYSPSVLLGNKLYFRIPLSHTVLKCDLELYEKSWFELPTLQHGSYSSVLMTTDGRLGLVGLLDGMLCIWMRMDTPEANAGWTQFKAIDLGKQELGVHPELIPRAYVVGFADALGIVFVTVNSTLYTVDLETSVVKKQVYNGGEIEIVFPYIHFYTPALEAASFGVEEEPRVAGSGA